jgi:uncharacterized membrane protein
MPTPKKSAKSPQKSGPKSPSLISPGIIVSFLIVLASFVAAFYFYPMMPDQMASHWGIDGQINGYVSRLWGVMLLPIISSALFLLFLFLPKMDPKKHNIEKFRKYFDVFIVLLFLFLTYIYALTIAWNLGHTFEMNRMIIPPFAVLFYYLGILMKHAEMNWSIGIRTPWTMESPTVWKKTNQLGGLLFQIAAIISLIGLLLPDYTFILLLGPILTVSVFIVFYSYFLYRKEKK